MKITHKVFGDEVDTHRTGRVENITEEEITAAVKGKPQRHKNEKKSVCWEFEVTVAGTVFVCSIWDWRGSADYGQYSCYLPYALGRKLFGARFTYEGNAGL